MNGSAYYALFVQAILMALTLFHVRLLWFQCLGLAGSSSIYELGYNLQNRHG